MRTLAVINFEDIVEAYELTSFGGSHENIAFLCKETGKIYYHNEDTNYELDELPDDIDDNEKYIQIPNKIELDLGKKLVLRFADQELPDDLDYIYRIFRKAGAYSRFKYLLDRKGLLEKWYEFETNAREQALREWCEINSIEIKRPEENTAG